MTQNDMKWREITFRDLKGREVIWNDVKLHEMTSDNMTWIETKWSFMVARQTVGGAVKKADKNVVLAILMGEWSRTIAQF